MSHYGFQIVAARALLRWTQADLAAKASVALSTIKRMEAHEGIMTGHASTITLIIRALEDAGVEFLNHGQPGVRLRKGE